MRWIVLGLMALICLLIVAQVVLVEVLCRAQAKERKELYDRIMAGSLDGYKAAENRSPAEPVVPGWKKAIDRWKEPIKKE